MSCSDCPADNINGVRSPGNSVRKKVITVLESVGLVVALVILWRVPVAHAWLLLVLAHIANVPVCGRCLFTGVYAVATVAMVPGGVLTIAAGTMFGPWLGTAVALAGALVGSSTAFVISRTIAAKRIARLPAAHHILAVAGRLMKRSGFTMVLLLRLSPLVPFNLLNYILGVTPVRFGPYFLASALGMLPGAFLYASAGSLLRSVAGSVTGSSPVSGHSWMQYGLTGAGFAATLAAVVLIGRAARAELGRATKAS